MAYKFENGANLNFSKILKILQKVNKMKKGASFFRRSFKSEEFFKKSKKRSFKK